MTTRTIMTTRRQRRRHLQREVHKPRRAAWIQGYRNNVAYPFPEAADPKPRYVRPMKASVPVSRPFGRIALANGARTAKQIRASGRRSRTRR